jgi:hypothetical protein
MFIGRKNTWRSRSREAQVVPLLSASAALAMSRLSGAAAEEEKAERRNGEREGGLNGPALFRKNRYKTCPYYKSVR